MDLHLLSFEGISDPQIHLSGSKSETNRWMLLQTLLPHIRLSHTSSSDDSRIMEAALLQRRGVVDCGHAGTAFRFLTAYFAQLEGADVIITGSERLCMRPIAPLVEALRQWGAQIEYIENEGRGPLRIVGQKLQPKPLRIEAHSSSQMISALLLITPTFQQKVTIDLEGPISSEPYIRMTLAMLEQLGFACRFEKGHIEVQPNPIANPIEAVVESDWSSASYWYAFVALSTPGQKVRLTQYYPNSLQGDAQVARLYESLGVKSTFESKGELCLTKQTIALPSEWEVDCTSCPDLAQGLLVTALGLGIPTHLKGLHTLRLKETDRIAAMHAELEKCEAIVSSGPDWIRLIPPKQWTQLPEIHTYQDHRMALAFAPLAVKRPLIIRNTEVVSKSYPAYWTDAQFAGLTANPI